MTFKVDETDINAIKNIFVRSTFVIKHISRLQNNDLLTTFSCNEYKNLPLFLHLMTFE